MAELSSAILLTVNSIAGCVGATVTMPFDVVKTRLQASNKLQTIKSAQSEVFFTRTFLSLKNIFAREGMHGLFRGLGPNLVGIIPSRSIYFWTYNATKESIPHDALHVSKDNPIIHIAAATSAGVMTATTMNPLWLVKTRVQLQEYQGHGAKTAASQATNGYYTGYIDCARRVYKEEGIRGLYKGVTASYLGIIESSLYFVIYEQMKLYRNNQKIEKGLDTSHFSGLEYLTMAGSAKLIAATISYPHEVLRTRLREVDANGRSIYTGLFNSAARIVREEGVRGLYSGMGAHLMRVVPNTAIMFLTYEFIIKMFSQQSNK
eukprot:GEZU01017680.1.p1 GENE.GEZU01017680.1~~GEZU01017680.1.p1  ORF type:complete len:319 (-),score=53.64 GEZU01017680.1:15-971(-)